MKRTLPLLLLLLAGWGARAQTLLQSQSFENGETINYTASTVASGNSNIYFYRASLPVPGFLSTSTVTNIRDANANSGGTYFWASENVRRDPSATNPVRANPPANLTLNPINVAGKSNLSVRVALADAAYTNTSGWETDDFVRIQYRFDGSGAWTNATGGQFVGTTDAVTGQPVKGYLTQDADGNGVADTNGAILTQALTDYTFPIPGSGSTLEVRVQIDQDGASEEFGFDAIRVYGSAAASAAPVLASIEGTALAYAEGAPATNITNTLTISDDGPTLNGAVISISNNFQSSEDQLVYVNRPGIPGSFNTGTGVLTLSGNATLAAYQAALRSIQYQNTDANDASPLTRTVSFNVTDATGVSSNTVTRNIAVTTALDPAYVGLPYVESFENPDGEGTRYASNHFFTQNAAQFQRTSTNPIPTGTTFSNIVGSYYWVGVNTNGGVALNPTGTNNGTVTTKQVNTAGYTNLHFQLRIGASTTVSTGNTANWKTSDYFQLLYRTAGSSTWTAFGLFRGTNPLPAGSPNSSGGVIRQDANPNGTGAPTGTQLTAALQNFDFALPASLSGQTLDFQLLLVNQDGVNFLAFDQLQVTGTPATTVNSIVRASANPTNAAVVNYTVTFGAAVTGLTASNFSLTTIGLSGATVGTPVMGAGNTWTVPVNTGTGSGPLTLSLANDNGLSYDITTPLPFAGETYTIDKAGPTVTSVAVPANGTYGNGQALNFTVNFSEATTVTGSPQLGLTIGSTGRTASYVSGSGSTALVFRYTVQSGDLDANGITLGTLALNGGTLRDVVGNDATLTLNGAPSTAGVLVDAVAPTVSSSNRQSPAAATTNATSLTFRVTFSEAVTGVSTASFIFTTTTGSTTGTIASVASVSGSNGTQFDVTVNSVSGSGAVRLDVKSSGSGISDAAGNGLSGGYTSGQTYTIDQTAPTVTALTTTAGTSGTATNTTPFNFTVTFSEAVTGFAASGIAVTNGTVTSGPTAGSGNSYTFTVTPTTAGTATTVTIAANAAQDAAGNGNPASSTYSLTYTLPTATVTAVTGQTPSPTATATVSYTVTFSAAVLGLGTGNFSLTTTGSISGASVASVSGSGATYTVVVNTGTGDGTLRLNVDNSAGVTPTVSNVPYTSGTTYTITKSFAASPTLRIQGVGSATGNSDVTAFVDVVQVLSGGSAVANALQNNSLETNNVAPGSYLYSPSVVAAPWSFGTQAGVSRNGSGGFGSTAASGDAVAFLQSAGGSNGSVSQSLTVPTGSYQVSFQTAQRNYTSLDQVLNVFVNNVFVGSIQPPNTAAYQTFSSATFSVGAPALTATVSTTSASPTSTAPIPFSVSFSQSVGTTFTATDVTVAGGTLTSGSFSGSSSGPYTFTVTPSGAGTVTVSLAAGVANDANNTPNTASNSVSVQYQTPTITVAPTTASLPGGTTGVPYSVTFTASGGSGTYTYIFSGTPPPGLTFAGSTLSGTPTASGTFNFRVTATDNSAAPGPYSGFRDYSVTIGQPTIAVNPASLPGGTQGVAYSATLSASGGTGSYTYAITSGALPSGLTLTTGGVLSGTPTVNGTFNFTVTARDAFGSTGSQPYTLVIAAPAVTAVTWKGAMSTDWFTAGNWSPAKVPDVTIDATIPTSPSGNRFPVISSGTANTRNLTLNSAATLTQSDGTLDVRGNLTNNGSLVATGGTVALGNSTLANILGSGNTRFWNLAVGTSGAQSSTSASTSVQRVLTLNGTFTTNSNPFTLESNASGTAMVVNNGTAVVSGQATYQRYIDPSANPGVGYRHFSVPTSNATVAGLATGSFTPTVNPDYNTSSQPNTVRPFPTVYGYDQARLATATNNLSAFDKGWFSPSTTGDALTVGRGYTVNLSANQTVSFTGPQNNAASQPISLSLLRNAAGTPNAADAGFHLVGNPFPSPLDYSLVAAADRANLDPAAYVYTSNSQYAGSYRTILNGVGGSSILPLGQAFFVHVANDATSATLNFRNSQRVTTYSNPAFLRTAETRPLVQLTLQGTGNALTDDAYVYFENGATDGYESAFDAVKLPNPTGLNLSTSLASKQLAIDGRLPLSTTQRVVPLAVGVPAVGSYTFRASQLLNLSTVPVYLRDLQTGALIDLAQQPTYEFTVSNASALIQGRFELVFSPQQLLATASAALAQQVGLYPNPAKTSAFVELPASLGRQAVTATLVDAVGRVVRTVVLPAQGALAHPLDLHELATGVYALRLSTSAGTVVKRLTIE